MDRYKSELDRKDKISAAVSFPVTVLIFLGGVIVTMARGLSHETEALTVAYVVGLIFWVVLAGCTLWLLSKAYSGQEYGYLPKLDDLENSRVLFEREEQENGPEGDAGAAFESDLRELIIEVTDVNRQANDMRQAYLDRANILLLVVVVMDACCGGIYVWDQILKR